MLLDDLEDDLEAQTAIENTRAATSVTENDNAITSIKSTLAVIINASIKAESSRANLACAAIAGNTPFTTGTTDGATDFATWYVLADGDVMHHVSHCFIIALDDMSDSD
jgi:hypothetical protein